MTFPILYSRTSKGQVQQWQIIVDGDKYKTIEGLHGGYILTTSSWTHCTGKNEGKANETNAGEQAEKEAAAKHKKKLESGYYEDIDDIDVAKFFEPMLAKKYKDYKDEIVFPVFSQGKLDGMRCIATPNGLFSRTGKPIVSCPHIQDILEPIFKKYPSITFDGELYNHSLKHDFNRIISLARQSKPTYEDFAASGKDIQYHIYDCFDKNNPERKFGDRLMLLNETIGHEISILDLEKVQILKTAIVKDQNFLDRLYEEYLNNGYEGQIIRTNTKYENKRTKALLKRKDFLEKEYELVNLEEGKGNRAGIASSADLKDSNGRIFSAGIIGTEEYAAELLKNKKKHIGQPATVIYFNLTPDGVPRFGKMKIIRNYE